MLTKTHLEKIEHSCKTQEKAISQSRNLKKANLMAEYLPTIAKIVFIIPPGIRVYSKS